MCVFIGVLANAPVCKCMCEYVRVWSGASVVECECGRVQVWLGASVVGCECGRPYDYRPTGVENLVRARVAKIKIPGPGLTLVFNFLINISI